MEMNLQLVGVLGAMGKEITFQTEGTSCGLEIKGKRNVQNGEMRGY